MINQNTQIYIHIIFAVDGKENYIEKQYRKALHTYISSIVKEEGQELISIFAMPDHIHILVKLMPNMTVCNLVKTIQESSSKYIQTQNWTKGQFQWKEAYGAYSFSQSQISTVVKFIIQQEEYHERERLKNEMHATLEKHDDEFHEKYMFEWIV